MSGSSGVVLENSVCRFLFFLHIGLVAAMLEMLEVWLVWSAKITFKTDTRSTLLAVQSQGRNIPHSPYTDELHD